MGAELVDCVHIRQALNAQKSRHSAGIVQHGWQIDKSLHLGCTAELALDQGYRVYFIDIAGLNSSSATNNQQKPLIIFAALQDFPAPEWAANQDEDELFKNWKPGRLNRRYPTNYAYVKMTNWYAYHMLKLQLLDFFDYAGKLDNDVSFVAPFPEPNLPVSRAIIYMVRFSVLPSQVLCILDL